jgi:ferritin-like protein
MSTPRVVDMWVRRARAEALSVRAFRSIAAGLRAQGDADLADLASRAVAEEQDHLERCLALARRFGASLDVPPSSGRARLEGRGLIRSVVRVCCVNETLNAALLRFSLLRATDPRTVQTLRALLGDEIRHAQLGWAVLTRHPSPWLSAALPELLAEAWPQRPGVFAQPLPTESEVALGVVGGCLSPLI